MYRIEFFTRRPRVLGFITGALLAAFVSLPVAAEKTYVVAGTAYEIVSNQVAYRELYTALDENKSVTVDYFSPDGNLFASKVLSYQGEYFQPGFELQDNRDNEFVAAQFQGARLLLSHGKDGKVNEKVVMDNARLVIDAGFDSYIQMNWDDLIAGKHLKFEFALPLRLSTIQLEARQVKASSSPLRDDNIGADWVHFRIAPAKALVSFFADPIYLAYNPNGKYLMRYFGRSNLDNDAGDPVDVRIEYEYLN
uniref:hypothetical protein n=1 Tax=Cellvibrio fontiphilus TaxID=1815559 RepID=UPI002B4C118C|nr:hypothetical protein [Cellvibrio fontiphilus]